MQSDTLTGVAQDYLTTLIDPSQPLDDRSRTGRKQPWTERKAQTELMAYAYDGIGNDRKATRLLTCAPRLVFARRPNGGQRLVNAKFCRVRLCPVCQWRRSLKLYGQTAAIVDSIAAKQRVSWAMLTLTVRNVDGIDLPNEISIMLRAWDRLCKLQAVQRAVLGWQRCLEVTHNVDLGSGSYNTYHPHLHILLCVRPSYYTSRDYISRDRWAEMWAQAARLDYAPQVWVTKVKGSTSAAIAEVTKYSAKPADILTPWDIDLMMESVAVMDASLHRRRLVAYGGLLKLEHQALGLDDPEGGDLVHTDTEAELAEATAGLTAYQWIPGYRQYYRER